MYKINGRFEFCNVGILVHVITYLMCINDFLYRDINGRFGDRHDVGILVHVEVRLWFQDLARLDAVPPTSQWK
jgi:hypothetical protein